MNICIMQFLMPVILILQNDILVCNLKLSIYLVYFDKTRVYERDNN
jgi:hypothetical protein